jgi:hypothetical protein
MTRYERERSEAFEPAALVADCIESGSRSILLDEDALPPAFFDLSTGLAGELLQKLASYHIRLAAVVPDPSIHSPRFQELAREASTGTMFRFFRTRQQAIDWLES